METKKLLSIILTIAILICTLPMGAVVANALSYGNYTYTVLDGAVTITDCSESASGNIVIPDQINGYNVVAIGDCAFENCDGIESVKIPYKVRKIGEDVFYGCSDFVARVYEDSFAHKYMIMKSIDYEILSVQAPSAPTAAVAGENIIELTHHDGYEYRVSGGDWQSSPVFDGVFPDSTYVFYQRVAQTFEHPASAASIACEIVTPSYQNADYKLDQFDRYNFDGYRCYNDAPMLSRVIIPTEYKGYPINIVDNYAFKNDTVLSEIILPEGITKIFFGAFSGCTSLETVKIPDSATKIDTEAFMDCTGLKNVVLGNSVEYIGQDAFKNCVSLVNIVLPNSVTTFGNSVFYGCTGLKTIVVPNNLEEITNSTFSNCENIEIIEVPASVPKVGYYAFDGCKNLTVVTTSNSAADIYVAKGTSTYKVEVEYYSSVKSKAPVVFYRNDTTAILVPFDGYEYRVDSGAWQDSNVFEGLEPGSTHLFYQRVKSTNYYNRLSAPLWVKMKDVPSAQKTPVAESVSGNSITLVANYGYEYKLGKGEWQTSNVFTNLTPGTEYTFYQRIAETGISVASKESKSYISTTKLTINAPDAPIVLNATDKTVQLEAIAGYEYKVNNGVWQTSNIFTNLNPNTEYTFYQRVSETDMTYASAASAGTKVTTNKSTASKPAAPTIKSKTDSSVTLTSISGYEYRKDDGTWQKSNVFNGLNPLTTYTFYQRKSETNTTYASESSDGLMVTTNAVVRRWRQTGGRWWYQIGSGYATHWLTIDGTWYYFDNSGWMQTGWQKISNKWYYFKSSGAMQTGWGKISGTWYYFNSSGAMQTGWKQISGTWYYFKSSGAMQTGWLKLSGKWYYFTSGGAMVTGSRTIGGKVYRFNASGACLNP